MSVVYVVTMGYFQFTEACVQWIHGRSFCVGENVYLHAWQKTMIHFYDTTFLFGTMILQYARTDLKAKFLVKELGAVECFVTLGFALVQVAIDKHFLQCFLLVGGDFVAGDDVFEVQVNLVTGRHDVHEVHVLDERLQLVDLAFDFLFTHGAGDLAGLLGQTSDQGAWELAALVPFVVGLDNDGLLPGVTSGREDDDFSFL